MRKAVALVIGGIGIAAASPALADNAMQVCGQKYQAAKAAKTLPAGQNWNQFLAQCRTTLAPAAKPVAATPAAKTLPGAKSPAMQAMHDRQRKCGQMWSADKAAGKIPAGQTWPKYWSACNTKLKG